jgi:hypothetical protein
MNYVQRWYQDLMSRSKLKVEQEIEAWGEYQKILGPRQMYARVKVAIGPGDSLKVSDNLPPDKASRLYNYGYDEPIVFGVLDVMLTCKQSPVFPFNLTILDVDIHEVHSSPLAFRLAAREAAKKILDQSNLPG